MVILYIPKFLKFGFNSYEWKYQKSNERVNFLFGLVKKKNTEKIFRKQFK